ncbi:MAG TPA: prepilin-type N-terminal cleavage/methylation domain-containing protein [Casimicrobium huifangae]|jgi:general secretion pathway protein I|uniref:type IV pilus modification PilV family protein n=1 Tax=Casimicrobium huifangae TaxID=2591109 RepID=UPI002BFDD13D|nr:prepilin-type N-terminal cleavage/methylation domain-containing protein [Casimicrobium huifangae]HQA32232.1 prepilin-type N-terminal cleavage/methylation domain-containing protein [Casimicrobium huifangae]HQD65884.1 prepilin-type N-terminal cleavage/methylation domain-containing protein [Casimicrobium huifangae]
MNRTSQRKARGFTLLEVIVAVIIAALCLSALAQVFATGVRAAGTASDYTRAVTLAQSLLAGAGVEKALEDGAEGGTTADGKLAWTLTVTQEPTEDADALVRPPLELKRVIARVSTVEADASVTRPRVVELSTLLAVPRPTP